MCHEHVSRTLRSECSAAPTNLLRSIGNNVRRYQHWNLLHWSVYFSIRIAFYQHRQFLEINNYIKDIIQNKDNNFSHSSVPRRNPLIPPPRFPYHESPRQMAARHGFQRKSGNWCLGTDRPQQAGVRHTAGRDTDGASAHGPRSLHSHGCCPHPREEKDTFR